MEIRTPKGKLYGILDIKSYNMTITDGRNIRQFPVPREGCTLCYKAGNNPEEVIVIKPQRSISTIT